MSYDVAFFISFDQGIILNNNLHSHRAYYAA